MNRLPVQIETGGGLLQTQAEAITQRAPEITRPVKLTACDEPALTSGYDILVFPDNIRYLNIQAADLPVLVKEHLVNNQEQQAPPQIYEAFYFHDPDSKIQPFLILPFD